VKKCYWCGQALAAKFCKEVFPNDETLSSRSTIPGTSQSGYDVKTEDFTHAFYLRCRERLLRKMNLYRTARSQSWSGYLLVYFTKAAPEAMEQPHPYVYRFPYPMPSEQRSKGRTRFFGSLMRTSPVKKRWCSMDSNTFVCFYSRSRTKVKQIVPLQYGVVRVIFSQFKESESGTDFTHPDDLFALVYRETVIVLRAEVFSEGVAWRQGLRARLLPPQIWERMENMTKQA